MKPARRTEASRRPEPTSGTPASDTQQASAAGTAVAEVPAGPAVAGLAGAAVAGFWPGPPPSHGPNGLRRTTSSPRLAL